MIRLLTIGLEIILTSVVNLSELCTIIKTIFSITARFA